MTDGPVDGQQLWWANGCPYCGTPTAAGAPQCHVCTFPLQDQRAHSVAALERSLADTDRTRLRLIAERNHLLGAHVPPPRPAGAPMSAGPLGLPQYGGFAPVPVKTPELKRRDTQQTILALGGVLLALAALVFAVVTWNHSGPAARAVLLLATTSAAAYAPLLLLARGLRDTAETIASVAAAMAAVDALMLRHIVAPGVQAFSFWAVSTVVLSVAYAAYGRLTGLRSPQVIAAATAQLPLILLAARLSAGSQTTALFCAATVGLDCAVWRSTRGASGPLEQARVVVSVAALLFTAVGLLLAVTAIDDGWRQTSTVLVACAALLAFAYLAGHYATIATTAVHETSLAACALAVTAVVTAVVNVLRIDSALGVGVVLAGAALLTAAVSLVVPATFRLGAPGAGALTLVAAVSQIGPLVGRGAVSAIWTGSAGTLSAPGAACLAAALLAITAASYLLTLTLLDSGLTRASRPAGLGVAFMAGGLAALVVALPITVPWSSTVVAWLTFGVGAATVLALVSLRRPDHPLPWLIGTGLALHGVALVAPDNRQLSFVLLALAAVMAASALVDVQRAPAVAIAILAATGAAAAALLVSGQHLIPSYVITLLVPALAGAALVVVDRTQRWRLSADTVVAAELSAATAAATAMVATFATSGAGWSAWAVAIAGVTVLAQSLRPNRRDAWYAGVALLTASSWTHLAVHDVHTVEAYSVPVSVVVLAIGWFRRRSDVTLTSAQAYGGGLMGLLIPSLVVGFTDAGIGRSVAVLIAAAAIAAVGASSRLQAPLTIGGVCALVDAVWLAAPHVAAMPRWLSLGSVGLVLVFLGATYERRRLQAEQLSDQLRSFG